MHFIFTTLGYHPENIGGAFRYVTELAEGLARSGHRVDVAYPSIELGGPAESSESRHGVTLHRFRALRGSFWRNWLERNKFMRAILERLGRDDPQALIISCHAYFARSVARSGLRIISLFTGPWAEEFLQSNILSARPFARERVIAPVLRRVERIGLDRSQIILTISQYYLGQLPVWHRALSKPIQVIEGGVNLQQFRPPPDRPKLRAQLGLGETDFLLIAVRRLEPRMGLLGLLESFASVASSFPQARLWIGGDGSQKDALAERIRTLNLSQQVCLRGFIPEADLASHYAAADCAVMPSIDLEGFGLATVEALACGTPVIGSSHGATPEILAGLDPRLVYSGPTRLPEMLREILATPAMLPSRTACREYAEARYSWNRPIEAFERACSSLPQESP